MVLGRLLHICWLLHFSSVFAVHYKLGYLYVQGGPSTANGYSDSWVQESFSHFKLGVQDVNADASILPNSTLQFEVFNTRGQAAVAAAGAVHLTEAGVVGVVGTGYSSAASGAAMICSYRRVPMVSPGATSIVLSNKDNYPFFSRSVPSGGGQWKMAVAVTYDLGWRRIGVLADTDESHYAATQKIITPALGASRISYLLLQYDTPVTPAAVTIPSALAALEAQLVVFKRSVYKVLMCVGYGRSGPSMAIAADRAGFALMSSAWVVIIDLFVPPFSNLDKTIVVKSPISGTSARAAAFQARWPIVSTRWNVSRDGGYDPSTGSPFFDRAAFTDAVIWDTDYGPVGDGLPDIWGQYVYDTVWLYARAIDALERAGQDPFHGDNLRSALLSQRFEGITGELAFDTLTQDRIGPAQCSLSSTDGSSTVLGVSRQALFDWRYSGPCRNCTSVDRGMVPWPSGRPPTDGREVTPSTSWVTGPQALLHEGVAVPITVNLRTAFGAVLCQDECRDGRSSACGTCLLDVFDIALVRCHAVDTSSNASAWPISAPDSVYDVVTGTAVLTFQHGFDGAGVEDRVLRVTIAYGLDDFLGDVVVSLQSTACYAGAHSLGGQCEPCPAGEFSSARGLVACGKCPRGTFQEKTSMRQCDPCPDGTFQQDSGKSECERCPRGEYGNTTGRSACIACRAGRSTAGIGFVDEASCLCPDGTFEDARTTFCHLCTRGMTCEGFGAAAQAQFGYYLTTAIGGLPSVFECLGDERRCPGGAAESCAAGRRDICCSGCEPGKVPTRITGGCREAAVVDAVWLPISIFLLVVILVAIYWRTAVAKHTREPHFTFQLGCIVAQIMNLSQILNVMPGLTVDLGEPVASLLRTFTLISFDWSSNVGVFLGSPFGFYLIRILLLPVFVIYLVVVHLITSAVCCIKNPCAKINALRGSVGLVIFLMFTAHTSASVAPFHCALHPNGMETMVTSGSTICWHTQLHKTIVITGLISLVLPLLFFTEVVRLVYLFPKRVAAHDEGFIHASAFLFLRFRPKAYWFLLVLMVRNLAISFVPMVPTAFWQAMLLEASILGYLFATLSIYPWRGLMANGVDVGSSIGLLFWMLVAGLSLRDTGFEPKDVSGFAFIVLCLILLMYFALVVFAIVKRVMKGRTKKYTFFLCHHKSTAGATARLFHILLTPVRRSDRVGKLLWQSGDVFIDSDNLFDLDTLFITVKTDVKTLVALCTSPVLLSPWCLGEITTAHEHRVRTVPVLLPGFEMPSDSFIASISCNVSFDILIARGISVGEVCAALFAMRDLPTVTCPEVYPERALHAVTHNLKLLAKDGSLSTGGSTMPPAPTAPAHSHVTTMSHMHVLVDVTSREAAAAGCVLVALLGRAETLIAARRPLMFDLTADMRMPCIGDRPYELASVKSMKSVQGAISHVISGVAVSASTKMAFMIDPLKDVSVAIAFCTNGCFESELFLVALAMHCDEASVCMLPVAAADSFAYPCAATYESIQKRECRLCARDDVPDCSLMVVAQLRAAFQRIACPFTVTRDLVTLQLQAQIVSDRTARLLQDCKAKAQKALPARRNESLAQASEEAEEALSTRPNRSLAEEVGGSGVDVGHQGGMTVFFENISFHSL